MAKLSWFNKLIKRNKSKENLNSSSTNQNHNQEKQNSPIEYESTEQAYEGEDEHEEIASMKREFSDFDLQEHAEPTKDSNFEPNGIHQNSNENFDDPILESGNVSDPGVERSQSWISSSLLKRSCSNLETRRVHEGLRRFPERPRENPGFELGSPESVRTQRSADKVMLRKHSSSQVLPSGSRRIWWKLFLWSHRNLHQSQNPSKSKPVLVSASNHQCGYSSDILEPNESTKSSNIGSGNEKSTRFANSQWDVRTQARTLKQKQSMKLSKIRSPTSSVDMDNEKSSRSANGNSSRLRPNDQWVAFSAEPSSFARVDEWVKNLSSQDLVSAVEDDTDNVEDNISFPLSPETNRTAAGNAVHLDGNVSEAIRHASSVVQSLNKSSSVAHISFIGLKAIPNISHFSSLKSVNLSNNYIVRITPGSLPKGLHSLNLSKNKIVAIEGLRELTRLRMLNLSYNRISRIGQGLSKCVLIKELYLAGNKINDVEGLHRLLKLTVLDLSFNKISTKKAIGQLVANYNSLLALNLLGNPIQSNIGDDQLRKAVYGLLPRLVYLNKQPLKPQRAREVLRDSVARAALGNNTFSMSPRRKTVKTKDTERGRRSKTQTQYPLRKA